MNETNSIYFLLAQLASIVWYASALNSRMKALESQKNVARSEYDVRDKSLSDSLADLKASQLRMEAKIDAISERK
jgi:hypothetical protein